MIADANPTTFDEAVKALHDIYGAETEILQAPETSDQLVSRVHHTIGRQIRNEWGLWVGGSLKEDMERLGFTHPDYMSSAILLRFICEIRSEAYDVEADAAQYRKYWENLRPTASHSGS